ncbi:MAG TPA: MFS transporter [Desulfuromonadales bacterium]|nr:MFS transporter [Desulfuromonadales bacterium]
MAIRWKIFSVLSFLYVMALFFRVSMAVVARDISTDFNLTATRLGTLSSVFFIVYALAQIPLGVLLDRFGGRIIVSILGIVSTAGVILFALAPGYYTALAGRVLLGIGTSCVLMGALKIFTNWFTREEFATIAGFIMAIGNLGNLLATAPLAAVVSAFGWRSALLVAALAQICATILVYTVATDTSVQNRSADTDAQYDDDASVRTSALGGLRAVLGYPSFWLLGMLGFCYYGNFMLIQSLWGGPYLMDVFHASRSSAGNVLFCSAGGFIVGCLCVGKISTHLLKSRKKTLLIGQSIALSLLLLLLGPAENFSPATLKVLFSVLGFTVSTGITIYPMVREMFPHAIAGTALSTLNFFVVSGVAVIQLLVGIILDRFPHASGSYSATAYHHAFFYPFCGLAGAILLFTFSKDTLSADTGE